MDELEKVAREQLMLWSGQVDALMRQREAILDSLSMTLEKIEDPTVKSGLYQLFTFVSITEQLNGIQTMHSALDHLLQNHNDEGIDGRHGYH